MKKIIVLLLIVSLSLGLLAGCGNKNKEPEKTDVSELTGQYFIDLTPSGMPMVAFIEIFDDRTFTLFNSLSELEENSNNRGNGVVSGIDDTFMLLYESEMHHGKTATFSVDNDGGLVFSTPLPWGTATNNFAEGYNIASRILPDRSNLPGSGIDKDALAEMEATKDNAENVEEITEAEDEAKPTVTPKATSTPNVNNDNNKTASEAVNEATPAAKGGGVFALSARRENDVPAMGGTIVETFDLTLNLDNNTFSFSGKQITPTQGTAELDFSGTVSGNAETGFTFNSQNSSPNTFTGKVVGSGIEFSPASALFTVGGPQTIILDGFNQ